MHTCLTIESLTSCWQCLHWVLKGVMITLEVNLRLLLLAHCLASHGSQLFKRSPVTMTNYFQKRRLQNTFFGCRNINPKIQHHQGEIAKPDGKLMRGSSLSGNMNLCLDLDVLIDNINKAKLIVRASFSNSQDFKESATH